MQYCPNCNANIEGLIHHCDCCGEPLERFDSIFVWHTFMTEASGDIQLFVKRVFDQLNHIDTGSISNHIHKIEFNLYCYPQDMVQNIGVKNSTRVSSASKKVTINIIIDYNTYIQKSKYQKEVAVAETIFSGFHLARKRLESLGINADHLLSDISKQIM